MTTPPSKTHAPIFMNFREIAQDIQSAFWDIFVPEALPSLLLH